MELPCNENHKKNESKENGMSEKKGNRIETNWIESYGKTGERQNVGRMNSYVWQFNWKFEIEKMNQALTLT